MRSFRVLRRDWRGGFPFSRRFHYVLAGLAVFLLLFLVASGILIYGSSRLHFGTIRTLQIPASAAVPAELHGVGLNLRALPSANRLRQADFEPETLRFAVPLSDVADRELSFLWADLLRQSPSLSLRPGLFAETESSARRLANGRYARLGAFRIRNLRFPVLGAPTRLRQTEGEAALPKKAAPSRMRALAWRRGPDGEIRDALMLGDGNQLLRVIGGSGEEALLDGPLSGDEDAKRVLLLDLAASDTSYLCLAGTALYTLEQFSEAWENVNLRQGPANWLPLCVASDGRSVYAGGSDGFVLQISETGERTWYQIAAGETIVAMCGASDGLLLRTNSGRLWAGSFPELKALDLKTESGSPIRFISISSLDRPLSERGSGAWENEGRNDVTGRASAYTALSASGELYFGLKPSELRRGEISAHATHAAKATDIHAFSDEAAWVTYADGTLALIWRRAADGSSLLPNAGTFGQRFFLADERMLIQQMDGSLESYPLLAQGALEAGSDAAPPLQVGDQVLLTCTMYPFRPLEQRKLHLASEAEAWTSGEGPGAEALNSKLLSRKEMEGKALPAGLFSESWLLREDGHLRLHPAAGDEAAWLEWSADLAQAMEDGRDGAAGSGGGLEISASELPLLSQNIAGRELKGGHIYRLEFQAALWRGTDGGAEGPRPDAEAAGGGEAGHIRVSLYGPLTRQVYTLPVSGTDWRRYQVDFVLPAREAKEGEHFRLGFDFETKAASVLAFRLPTIQAFREDPNRLCTEDQQVVEAMAADIFRFGELGLASPRQRESRWARAAALRYSIYDSDNPGRCALGLEYALQLCREQKATPWLSVDAFASEEEIQNFLEYLAGPASERYGKLRLERGTAPPWTAAFGRIYLEIKDDQNVFRTVDERAAYVRSVLGMVQSSPYYDQIKNQLVFVDGMNYGGADMRSGADIHASDFPNETSKTTGIAMGAAKAEATDWTEPAAGKSATPRQRFLEMTKTLYRQSHAERPRLLREEGELGEALRSLAIPGQEDTPDAAAGQAFVRALYEYGAGTSLVLLDYPQPGLSRGESRDSLQAFFALASKLRDRQLVSRSEEGDLLQLLYSDGERRALLLWNLAEEGRSVMLETGGTQPNAKYQRYDMKLRLLQEQPYPGDGRRIDVLPGEMLLIRLDEGGG